MRILLIAVLSLCLNAFSAQLEDSVFHLTVKTPTGTLHGTAFAAEINNHKYIVTAAHNTVEEGKPVIKGRELRPILIDRALDLAIYDLQCEEFKDYLEISLEDSKAGEAVQSISYPEGRFGKSTGTVTGTYKTLVSADLPDTYQGSSGSPVFNGSKVIGVLVAVEADKNGKPVRGKAYFVPIKRVLEILLLQDYMKEFK